MTTISEIWNWIFRPYYYYFFFLFLFIYFFFFCTFNVTYGSTTTQRMFLVCFFFVFFLFFVVVVVFFVFVFFLLLFFFSSWRLSTQRLQLSGCDGGSLWTCSNSRGQIPFRIYLHVSCFFILAPIDTATTTQRLRRWVSMNLSPLTWATKFRIYLPVDRSHVSDIHEGKIGNGTTHAPLISSVSRRYANKWHILVAPYSPRGGGRLGRICFFLLLLLLLF